MKTCQQCGNPSIDNAKFCGYCGNKFPAQDYLPQPAPIQPAPIIDLEDYSVYENELQTWLNKIWTYIRGLSNRNRIIAAVCALIILCCFCSCSMSSVRSIFGNPAPTSTATVTETPQETLSPTPHPTGTFTPSPTITASPLPSPTDTVQPTISPTTTLTPQPIIQPTSEPIIIQPTENSGTTNQVCCKNCDPAKSKPCGDSCISLGKTCQKGQGCACSK